MGASGSGTTTLGKALADRLGIASLDGDDYYWLPTDPSFQHKRDPQTRLSLLLADTENAGSFVFSGSVMEWGTEIEDSFTIIFFLTLSASIRVARLHERETARFGKADPIFLEWAAQYDEGRLSGRSLSRHTKWLAERGCPIIRLDGDLTVEERITRCLEAIKLC